MVGTGIASEEVHHLAVVLQVAVVLSAVITVAISVSVEKAVSDLLLTSLFSLGHR